MMLLFFLTAAEALMRYETHTNIPPDESGSIIRYRPLRLHQRDRVSSNLACAVSIIHRDIIYTI